MSERNKALCKGLARRGHFISRFVEMQKGRGTRQPLFNANGTDRWQATPLFLDSIRLAPEVMQPDCKALYPALPTPLFSHPLKTMANKQTQETEEELVRNIDFPHLRDKQKGKWLKTGPGPKCKPGESFDRLCFYAKRLRKLGMSDVDIACMFSDLYWDAVTENDLNKKKRPR